MRILGMVTHTHDTGIALVKDGVPEFVIEEERLNREKKTQRFPAEALDTALAESGISIGDVDAGASNVTTRLQVTNMLHVEADQPANASTPGGLTGEFRLEIEPPTAGS